MKDARERSPHRKGVRSRGFRVEVEGVIIPIDREALFEFLRSLGYEPRERETVELREAEYIQPLVLWLAEHIGAPAALQLARDVVRWFHARRRGRKPRGRVQVIYGPTGETLTQVKVGEDGPEPDAR